MPRPLPRRTQEEGVSLRVHLDSVVSWQAARTILRCAESASSYASSPISSSSLVEPSTSVKRKVTVPVGRSGRIDGLRIMKNGSANTSRT